MRVAAALLGLFLCLGLATASPSSSEVSPVCAPGWFAVDAQSWWRDSTTGFSDVQAKHLHIGGCVPRRETTLSGTVPFDVNVKMHNNDGRVTYVAIVWETSGGDHTYQQVNPGWTCGLGLNCTFTQHFDLPTSVFDHSGLEGIRLRVTSREPNGKEMRASVNLQTHIANGKTAGDMTRMPYLRGKGWYTDLSYCEAALRTDLVNLPSSPVSGTWTPNIRQIDHGSSDADPTYWSIRLDPDIHTGMAGTFLGQNVGSRDGPFPIDTRGLDNGSHKLFIETECQTSVGENGGILVVPFEVQNEVIPPPPPPPPEPPPPPPPLFSTTAWGMANLPTSPVPSGYCADSGNGVKFALVEMNWSDAETTEDVWNEAYFDQQLAKKNAYVAAGCKVTLNWGIHHAPGWLLAKPSARYVNQFGQVWSEDLADLVFATEYRPEAEEYAAKVFAELGPMTLANGWHSIRNGGGRYGELGYPDNRVNTSLNQSGFWAFSADARAQAPSGYVPCTGSQLLASAWLSWYLDRLAAYGRWQIDLVRQYVTDPAVYVSMLLPGYGMRPTSGSYGNVGTSFENAVATNLCNPNSEVYTGRDHARQAQALVGAASPSLWYGAANNADWTDWIKSLADPRGFPLIGENSGPGSDQKAIDLVAYCKSRILPACLYIRYTEPGVSTFLAQIATTPPPSTGLAEKAVNNFCTRTWESPSLRDAIFDKMAAAGFKWIRIPPEWAVWETSRGVVSTSYTAMVDSCVDAARARGLKVIMILATTPSWARSGGDWRTPPTDPNDFGWFCGWTAQHFFGRIDALEVLNEQNSTSFYTGTISQYVGMLRACFQSSRLAAPLLPVLIGGIAYVDTAYLTSLYDAGGGPYFDAGNVHPYNDGTAPESACVNGTFGGHRLTCLPNMRAVMDAHGDSGKPIWVTEFGWSVDFNPPDQQAGYAVRAYSYMRANYPYVPVAAWYKDMSQSGSPCCDHEQGFGLLYSDLSSRPVYNLLAAIP